MFGAAALLFTGGCAFSPGKTTTTGATPEELEAFRKHIEAEQAAWRGEKLDEARQDAAGKIVSAACFNNENQRTTLNQQIKCAALLRAFAEVNKNKTNLSGTSKAYVKMGKDLSAQSGNWGCSISNQEIVCNFIPTDGYIARADSPQSFTVSKIVRLTPGKHVKKNKQPSHIALGKLTVVADQSYSAFAFGDISPANTKEETTSTVITSSWASPLRKVLMANNQIAQKIAPPLAATQQETIKPPYAPPSLKTTLRVAITENDSSEPAIDKKPTKWNPLLMWAVALAVIPGVAAFSSKKKKGTSAPLTHILATAWSRRHEIRAELNRKKWSIIAGGAFGASSRILTKFTLAKVITIPLVATAGASAPTILAGMGVAACCAIVAGAVGGALGEVGRTAFNQTMRQEKGWVGRALRRGMNTGVWSGLFFGAVADAVAHDGLLHNSVVKPVLDAMREHIPNGVKSFFGKMVDIGSWKEMFSGANPVEQIHETTGMDPYSMQAAAPEPAPQVAATPTPAPVEPQATQLASTPATPEPAQPVVATPEPEPLTQAAPSVPSNVPKLFDKILSPELYDMMGHDEAGRAVQRKLIEAAKHPSDIKALLGAYKEASYHLLNEMEGNATTHEAAKKLLLSGYKLVTENEMFANPANITRTGKNVIRDLADVLLQDGGEENMKQAAHVASLGDQSDKTIKSIMKTIKSIRPDIITNLGTKGLAPAL